MKKATLFLGLFILASTLFSCASEASMQKYYIDHQDHENFRVLDIPASIITLKDDASPQAKEAFKSLKKFNVLAFVKDENNILEFKKEKQNIKLILKDKKYNELIRIKDKGRNIIVKYEGTDDAIDEVYLYASDKAFGFAVVRVLGDNMKPEYISIIMNNIKDINTGDFKELVDLFIGGKSN